MQQSQSKFVARVRFGGGRRQRFALSVDNETSASERARKMTELAKRRDVLGPEVEHVLRQCALADSETEVDRLIAEVESGAAVAKIGRPRTGSLYWTKSGWRGRVTLEIDGKTVQRSFDLKTHIKAEAKIALERLAADYALKIQPVVPVVPIVSVVDLAKSAGVDPCELALSIAIKEASAASQWNLVAHLSETLRVLTGSKTVA